MLQQWLLIISLQWKNAEKLSVLWLQSIHQTKCHYSCRNYLVIDSFTFWGLSKLPVQSCQNCVHNRGLCHWSKPLHLVCKGHSINCFHRLRPLNLWSLQSAGGTGQTAYPPHTRGSRNCYVTGWSRWCCFCFNLNSVYHDVPGFAQIKLEGQDQNDSLFSHSCLLASLQHTYLQSFWDIHLMLARKNRHYWVLGFDLAEKSYWFFKEWHGKPSCITPSIWRCG